MIEKMRKMHFIEVLVEIRSTCSKQTWAHIHYDFQFDKSTLWRQDVAIDLTPVSSQMFSHRNWNQSWSEKIMFTVIHTPNISLPYNQ